MTQTREEPRVEPLAAARAITRINLAYAQARVLHAAVELGLFEALVEAPVSGEALATRLGLHPRLAPDFLGALAGLGLLERTAEGYRNAPGAERYLVPGGREYIGASVLAHGRVHYGLWADFAGALRDGHARSDRTTGAGAVGAGAGADLDRARRFLAHMEAFSGFVAEELAAAYDWAGADSFVDVGGGRGHVAAGLVAAHPHLSGAVFDVPGVAPLFAEHMADLGTAGRVRFHGGDFFADPLPTADVAIVGHVLHDWPVEARRALLASVTAAVRPGGALLVYDAMIDGAPSDPMPYLRSLVCAVIRDGGSEYPVDACRDWVEEAGFTVDRVVPLATIAGDRLLIASRSGQ